MNYEKIYNDIISKAKSENRIKYNNIYYENHHIIPKCMNGTNDSNNLVLLTAKEHFICHHLLIEFVPVQFKNKLSFAFYAMCNQLQGDCNRTYRVSAKTYAYAKEEFAKANSKLHKGKTVSERHIQVCRDRMNSDLNPMRGKHGIDNPLYNTQRTQSTKDKISNTQKLFPERNPQFKGYYHTPNGIFTSTHLASKANDNIKPDTILIMCKNCDKIITKRMISHTTLKNYDILGKTYKELGWFFTPKS